jgi:hypothetical protein
MEIQEPCTTSVSNQVGPVHPSNDRVQARSVCGVEPSRADLFVGVSSSPAGDEAASPAANVGRRFYYVFC